MSVTTVVTADAFEATSKAALKEFLLTYFDGQAHSIGRRSVTFPVVDVQFGRRVIPRPQTVPLIALTTLGQGSQAQYGQNIQRTVTWQILAIDADKTGRTADQLASLLDLVFTSCRHVLAVSGLKAMKISRSLPLDDYNHEYQVTQRTVTLRATLTPGVGGQSRNSVFVTGEVA